MADLPLPPPIKPFRIKPLPGGVWYRVHRFDRLSGHYASTAFNDTPHGNARFSPLIDPATGGVIPTLYAAQTPRGAIAEVELHDVPTPSTGHLHDWEQDKASLLHLSKIALPDLVLANLSSVGLRACGLKVADLFGTEQPDYLRTRQWALHVWQHMPAAHGLYWMSVRDNTCPVVMLFGDRVPAGALWDAGRTQPIAHFESEVFQLLDDLGCGLAFG
ncbi:RES family NAD+ phosphorylase [Sphaerotilus sp.]|uniref:RES family NAD+ phosphorylase n=1 Tax=Sphaerotilus sp. TaxID=2093942 RepID=UPI00286E1C3A|nr:RES family NAD+ phosphorylase [Sphaerotilus sp.]